MGQKVNIPSQNQPFRRQASIGGNVSFRNIGDNNDNSFIALAKVTRVYYQRGKLDFKLTNTNSLVADRSGNGSGSAPIPVDFFGRRKNGQVFGHYRPVKIGDLIAVAYVNGHKSSPIVIGVYPNSGQDYEIISPSLYLDGDDEDAGVAETALAEQKIYPSMQLEYRSGSGTIAKALNGHSFLTVDDETSHQYDKLWQNYNTVGFFHNSSDAINPLKETAGDWLLVHEDNPLSDDGDNHRTRFFVNKKGEIQIVLMDNTSAGTISVLEGSKQDGFTISQYYDLQAKKSGDLSDDVYEPDFKSATNYVSLNVGKDQEIALEVAAKNSSKLELKSDGLYLNGKPFVESLNQRLDDLSDNIKKDIHQEVPSNSDFKELAKSINENVQAARQEAESARQAGENAKDIGLAAERAGEDAKASGDDIKKRIIYYASISKEKDIAIPGKYIIINTDTYIKDGTIKNAYIENGAIDHAKIANEAVWSSQIANLAVTNAKIAYGAVDTAQIKDLAVTDAKIGSLSADKITTGTLDAGQVNVINLKADSIVAGTITADKLNIKGLSDITSNAGTISKGRIQAGDDPNSGVVIDNLDADNPNKYTPAKKAFLLSEVKKLNSAAEAAIDYGKQTHTDYSAVEKAKQAMDDGLAPLLGDMATTTEFDYNKVIKLEQDLQDAVNAFHSKSNSDIMAQIGTTAGKNAIYRGANDPVTMGVQPHENDMWLQILSNGTYNIRVWDGAQWINPGLADIKAVSDYLSNLSKSYYQPEEPVGGDVHDGDTWYKLTKGSDGKYTYVAYKREGNSWTPLLNAGEVSNQSSINTLQNDLEQARELIKDDGGGINLYTGTENFSNIAGRSWFHRSDANWSLTDRRDPNGNPEMQKNGGAWNGLGQAISVEPGKYTFSCYLWVHLTGNETLNFYAGDNQYEGTATVGTTDGTTQFTANDSDKYIHVTITYNVTNGGVLAIRPELNQDSGTFWVSSYKLEKGSQATPWCHNGNDYMAGIAAVQGDVNSATAAIQQARASAASDAAKIRADVAKIESEVASAKSASQDSINTLQNDINTAKQDLANVHDSLTKAQSAVEQNQKLINDSVAKISNDIAQDRKDLATAQQNNADLAKQLDDYSKQAEAQGKTIEKMQTDDNSTKLTIADIKGNVSQVQGSVTGLTANLKDANDNLATVKALADSLSSTLTDHGKNIASLQATAKELSSTLGDADGRLSKVEQTATEHSTTISNLLSEVEWKRVSNSALDTMKSAGHFWGTGKDLTGKPGNIKDTDQVRVVVDVPSDDSISQILYANNIVWQRSFNGNAWSEWVRSANQGDVDTLQGNITQVKQTADGLTDTLKDAQGSIDKVRATAKGLSEQITNAQGDITALQTDVTSIKATIADHDKNIHTLQADSKSLTDDITDAQGNISKLQKTSTDLTSEMQDHDGRLSKVEQTANTLTNEFSDQQGHLNRVEQTANGTQQTVANQQGQINNIKTDAASIHETLTGQGNQIANINVTLSGLNTKYEGVSGDLNNLKSQAQWATVTSAVDLNNVKTPCHEFLKGTVTNAPNEVAWWYLTVEGSESGRITQTVIADQSNNRYTRRWADSWSAWVRDATQTDVTALSNRITTNSTQITQNQQAIALKADQTTVNNLSGEVNQNKAQLKVQADQISSKVSSDDFKTLDNKVGGAITQIQKNSTAIDQTNKQISLKADQTEVNNIKNMATQNSSRLDVMANEISSKVTSTDVNNIVDGKGYATTSTVQSLITQKAGTINESITNLDAKYSAKDGVNLVRASSFHNVTLDDLRNSGWSLYKAWINKNGGSNKQGSIVIDATSITTGADDIVQTIPLEPDTDYTLSFHLIYVDVASGKSFNACSLVVEEDSNSRAVSPYVDHNCPMTNSDDRKLNTRTFHTSKNTHQGVLYLRAMAGTKIELEEVKLERGSVATPWTPAPSDNATVTQLQSVTASLDGLKSIVVNKDGIASMINQKADSIEAGITGKLSSLNYGGLVLDKNGATLTSGNTHVYLNGTNGFQIQNGNDDVFHVDRSGSLTMQGNIMGGDITGVNFTGSNLTLTGDLRVINKENKVGHILLGDTAVLDSQGLSIKGAGLSISDNQGNQTTYVDQHGTFVTKKGVFNGNVTATSLTIPEGSSADINVAGKFRVKPNGDVIANSFTATGGLLMQGSIQSSSISAADITGGHIYGTHIYGTDIHGADIENTLYQNYSSRTGYIEEPLNITSSVEDTVKNKLIPTFNIRSDGNIVFANKCYAIPSNPTDLTFTSGSNKATFKYGLSSDFTSPSLIGSIAGGNLDVRDSYSIGGLGGSENTITYVMSESLKEGQSDGNYAVYAIFPFATLSKNDFISKIVLNYQIAFDNFMDYAVYRPGDTDMNFSLVAWSQNNGIFVEYNDGGIINKMTKDDPRALGNSDQYVLADSSHHIANYGSFSDTLDISSLKGNDIGVGIIINQTFSSLDAVSFALDSLNWIDNVSESNTVSSIKGNHGLSDKSVIDDSQKLTITPTGSFIQESSYTDLNASANNDSTGAHIYSSSLTINHGRINFASIPQYSQDGRKDHTHQLMSYLDGERLEFLPSNTEDSNRNAPRLLFDGIRGDTAGIMFNSYGNMIGTRNSRHWKIDDYQSNCVLSVPLNQTEPFTFNVPDAGWGGLKIGWVKFDDWNTGPVPAIYNDKTHLSGIAIWDRNVVLFVDGWAWNMTDKGLVNSVNTNNKNGKLVGTHALNKDAPKK